MIALKRGEMLIEALGSSDKQATLPGLAIRIPNPRAESGGRVLDSASPVCHNLRSLFNIHRT